MFYGDGNGGIYPFEIQLGLRNYYILQKELDVDTFLQKRIRWNLKSVKDGQSLLISFLSQQKKKKNGVQLHSWVWAFGLVWAEGKNVRS